MRNLNSKRLRVPWKIGHSAGEPVVTVPIFLAYLGVAAALRHVARPDNKFIAILRVEDRDAIDSCSEALRIFINRLAGSTFPDEDSWVKLIKKPAKGERADYDILFKALEKARTVYVCESGSEFDDETRLAIDLDISIPKLTRWQVAAMLKRFGHPVTDPDVDTVLSASWKNLRFAFWPHRSIAIGLRRLRELQSCKPVAKAEAVATGPTLDELHGFGPAADWGQELARDIADFKELRIEWADVDSGVLISGPPGTGKTMFATALARTCNVPLVAGSAAQWQASGYLNDFLKAMNATFAEAKSKSPCLLFIDEIDAFGDRNLADHNADYKRQAINGLLGLLDGFDRRTGVVVVAATNHPDDLDPAIRRAGRLGTHIEIAPPDGHARLKIFQYHAGIEIPGEQIERFARATRGMSGADIEQLVRDAKRTARRRSSSLQIDDVLKHLRPLVPLPEEFIQSASLHETGHAIVGLELGIGKLRGIRITDEIVPGGVNVLGGAIFIIPEFAQKTRKYYDNYLSMLLAGIAAETLVLGTFADGATGGADSDLVKATEIATLVEACYGMGATLVVEDVRKRDLKDLRSKNPELRKSVHNLLENQFERAKNILTANRDALEEVAGELMVLRHVTGDTVNAVMEKHRLPCMSVSLAKRG